MSRLFLWYASAFDSQEAANRRGERQDDGTVQWSRLPRNQRRDSTKMSSAGSAGNASRRFLLASR